MSTEPIKAGDLCEVISGMGRERSPNLGLRVKATVMRGEHSKFGRVWRCTGEGVLQLHPDSGEYIVTGWADFPVTWLRKLPPDESRAPAVSTKREVTA